MSRRRRSRHKSVDMVCVGPAQVSVPFGHPSKPPLDMEMSGYDSTPYEVELLDEKTCDNGQEILLEAKGLSDYGEFREVTTRGIEKLSSVMSFMIGGREDTVLEIMCRGNNLKEIAYALASIFHGGEYVSREVDIRVLKAKGYDRLRGLVKSCHSAITADGDSKVFPKGYGRLVNRLFISQGYPGP